MSDDDLEAIRAMAEQAGTYLNFRLEV